MSAAALPKPDPDRDQDRTIVLDFEENIGWWVRWSGGRKEDGPYETPEEALEAVPEGVKFW